MIGVSELQELIATIILTGRVKGRKPVSAFLIARPESGKTTIVQASSPKHDGDPSVIVVTDATGQGLMHLCRRYPRATHVIFNDLTIVSGHGKQTQKYMQSMVNAMTEEGIREVWTPAGQEKIDGGLKGIIAACTPTLAVDGRRWWHSIGLDSRCIPIFYEYRERLVLKIQNGLIFGFNGKNSVAQIPKLPISVSIPKKLGPTIIDLANVKAREFGEMGIRKTEQFTTLLCAHAILRSWKNPQVGIKDISWFYSASKFMSWTKGVEIG